MAKLRKTTKPPRPKGQAPIRPIRIMISSRCNDKFPAKASTTLTEARRKIKDCLESQTLFGRNIFEVWINEDEPAVPSQDGWDKCMAEVDRCDILVVLFNGNAGWAVGPGDTGICHGEFHRGHSRAPGKVYLI